jgi:hypothetical protein
MTNKVKKIVLFPIMTFGIAALMLSCTSLAGFEPKSNLETENTKAFKLSGLSINPPTVAPRDEVVITAEVANVSDVDGAYNAELKINNVTEASDKVFVPTGKSQLLTFVIFKDKPGTYKVALGELADRFIVAESVATVPGNQATALPGQTGASCCSVGNQSTSSTLGQAGASCCGVGAQSNPVTPRSSSGYGCCGR